MATQTRGGVQVVRSDKVKEPVKPKIALFANGVFPVISSPDVRASKLNIPNQRKHKAQST